jgi:hypothetical protein
MNIVSIDLNSARVHLEILLTGNIFGGLDIGGKCLAGKFWRKIFWRAFHDHELYSQNLIFSIAYELAK